MNSKRKYKVIALVLTLAFCLSNVGLPIVLASCPMFGNARHCPMCPEKSAPASAKLSGIQNTSCCKTIIAGERNKTEFVQSQDQKKNLTELTLIAPLIQSVNIGISQSSRQLIAEVFALPQFSRDISIFNSSLLI